ncbi:Sensor histidine kinase YpdA [compost metagenome]
MRNQILRRLDDWFEPVTRRLANKLILTFTIIIVLVVSSLTFISYSMLRRESVNSSIASTDNNLLLVGRNFDSYLKGIEQLSLPQISYDEFNYALLHETQDYASKMYLESYLKNLYFSRSDLETIYLYILKEHKYYWVTKENYNITVRVAEHPSIENLPWYKSALGSPSNRSYQSLLGAGDGGAVGRSPADYPVDSGRSFMGYHRLFRSIVTREPEAVLSLYFNSTGANEILKDIPFSTGQHLMLLGPDNAPYIVDDKGFYNHSVQSGLLSSLNRGEGRFVLEDSGEKYLVIANTGSAQGWKLVKPIPYRMIYEAATTTRRWSLIIGVLFLVMSIVLTGVISTRITRPLKDLSLQMRRFGQGSFNAEAKVKGRDEIAYLSMHFNKMVKKTNELINERFKLKIAEKNAVLKALEAEINPHFLYNALQAISTRALKNGSADIVEMVDNLALTLRYCVSGRETVTAREELKHIERYLALQKARFGSRMQVAYDWDESLMELSMPKLALQTLVENAIKHGLERISSPITITISARPEDGRAAITVHDDGPGISPERLEQVRRALRKSWEAHGEMEPDGSGGGIGLRNLDMRLKLLYGEEAGLEIESGPDGTVMSMKLPIGGVTRA